MLNKRGKKISGYKNKTKWINIESLPDKWWSRPSQGYTGRWRHTGWSGCCRSWSPAYSLSPGRRWSRSCSCHSGRSPVQKTQPAITNMVAGLNGRDPIEARCNALRQRWPPYHRVVTQRVGGAAAVVGPFAFIDVVADLKLNEVIMSKLCFLIFECMGHRWGARKEKIVLFLMSCDLLLPISPPTENLIWFHSNKLETKNVARRRKNYPECKNMFTDLTNKQSERHRTTWPPFCGTWREFPLKILRLLN